MNRDPYQPVRCPKCKGGCTLCGGTGCVLTGVADAYNREEGRSTVRIKPPTTVLKDAMRTSGLPAVIQKANALRQATWAYIGIGVLGGVLLIVIAMKGCP